MAQNNSGSVNFNFKNKNIQTSMINIEVFKPKTFKPRVPGVQPTPGKRRTVLLVNPSMYPYILFILFCILIPSANALFETTADCWVAGTICIFLCIVACMIFLCVIFTFYMCFNVAAAFNVHVTKMGTFMSHSINDSRRRLHANADDYVWWYKLNNVLTIGSGALGLFARMFGCAFSSSDVQFHAQGYTHKGRWYDDDKVEKNKRKSNGWIYGLLCLCGIGYWAVSGRVPTQVKDGIFAFSKFNDAWKFMSNCAAGAANYFNVGHIPGCECVVCETLEETVGPYNADTKTPFDPKDKVNTNDVDYVESILHNGKRITKTVVIDDDDDSIRVRTGKPYVCIPIHGVDNDCEACEKRHVAASDVSRCFALRAEKRRKLVQEYIRAGEAEDKVAPVNYTVIMKPDEFEDIPTYYPFSMIKITESARLAIYHRLKKSAARRNISFAAALNEYKDFRYFEKKVIKDEIPVQKDVSKEASSIASKVREEIKKKKKGKMIVEESIEKEIDLINSEIEDVNECCPIDTSAGVGSFLPAPDDIIPGDSIGSTNGRISLEDDVPLVLTETPKHVVVIREFNAKGCAAVLERDDHWQREHLRTCTQCTDAVRCPTFPAKDFHLVGDDANRHHAAVHDNFIKNHENSHITIENVPDVSADSKETVHVKKQAVDFSSWYAIAKNVGRKCSFGPFKSLLSYVIGKVQPDVPLIVIDSTTDVIYSRKVDTIPTVEHKVHNFLTTYGEEIVIVASFALYGCVAWFAGKSLKDLLKRKADEISIPIRNSVDIKKECIHYKNCPEQSMKIDAKHNCGLTCTGRNCVHFAGCVPKDSVVKESGPVKRNSQPSGIKKVVRQPNANFNIYNYDANAIIKVGELSLRLGDNAFYKYLETIPQTTAKIVVPNGSHNVVITRQSKPDPTIRVIPKNKIERETIRSPVKKCPYCKHYHKGHSGCRINLESLRDAHKRSIFVHLSPQSLLTVAQRMDVQRFHNRMYKVIIDGDFICNAFSFASKLITTLHGVDAVSYFTAMGSCGVYKLTDHNKEIIDDDLVTYRLNGVSGTPLKFNVPLDGEDCMLIAYDSASDKAPKISAGVINKEGFHTCSSIVGNCGGIIINMAGEVIAVHNGGATVVNKAIPLTPDLIQALKQGFQ